MSFKYSLEFLAVEFRTSYLSMISITTTVLGIRHVNLPSETAAATDLSIRPVNSPNEAVVGDVVQMSTVLEPRSSGTDMVSCTLALHL